MASENIYKGPNFTQEPTAKELGTYTVADQSRAFGVPEDQLLPDSLVVTGLSGRTPLGTAPVKKVFDGGTTG